MAKMSKRDRRLRRERDARREAQKQEEARRARRIAERSACLEAREAQKAQRRAERPVDVRVVQAVVKVVSRTASVPEIAMAQRLDASRWLDRSLRGLVLRRLVPRDQIERLRYCTTLDRFLTMLDRWPVEAAESVWVPHRSRISPECMKEVWRLFRLRIRREDAIMRIQYGTIFLPRQKPSPRQAA